MKGKALRITDNVMHHQLRLLRDARMLHLKTNGALLTVNKPFFAFGPSCRRGFGQERVQGGSSSIHLVVMKGHVIALVSFASCRVRFEYGFYLSLFLWR